jgi:hypothetical protein
LDVYSSGSFTSKAKEKAACIQGAFHLDRDGNLSNDSMHGGDAVADVPNAEGHPEGMQDPDADPIQAMRDYLAMTGYAAISDGHEVPPDLTPSPYQALLIERLLVMPTWSLCDPWARLYSTYPHRSLLELMFWPIISE